MKNYKITNFEINQLGLILDISYSYDIPDKKVDRVFFISKDAVSRHENRQNLEDCLNSKKSFKNDAFIFTCERAISEIRHNILNADDITEYQVNVLNEYIKYLNHLGK